MKDCTEFSERDYNSDIAIIKQDGSWQIVWIGGGDQNRVGENMQRAPIGKSEFWFQYEEEIAHTASH